MNDLLLIRRSRLRLVVVFLGVLLVGLAGYLGFVAFVGSEAPRGFRRTVVLERSLPGLSSRDPGLTNRPLNRGKSGW